MASALLNTARFASTHAAPLSAGKHKIVVIGAGQLRAAAVLARLGCSPGSIHPPENTGAGGLAVANQLYNKFKADGQELARGDIAIVDVRTTFTRSSTLSDMTLFQGAKTHHYQPGWTLVGAGMRAKEEFARPMESVIAPHFAHLNSHAKTLNPSSNSLTLESGETVKYDYLVVAPGLKSSKSELDKPNRFAPV